MGKKIKQQILLSMTKLNIKY